MKMFIYFALSLLLPNLFIPLWGQNPVGIYPRLNLINEATLPANFRKSDDPYKQEFNPEISRLGLEKIRASASAQFSEKSLQVLKEQLPENLIIFDLRREFHGFINGLVVNWCINTADNLPSYEYNKDLSVKQIEMGEKLLLREQLLEKTHRYKTLTGMKKITVKTVATERQLVEKLGIQYIRFPIADHLYPNDQEVDNFIKFVKPLSKKTWIHFHCAGGRGRSTTLICMLDIMANHQDLSVQEIIERQEALGGKNLYGTEAFIGQVEKLVNAQLRHKFLILFHKYCQEHPDFKKSWVSFISALNNN